MTVEEATRAVAYLNAYFPNESVEPETFRVWVEEVVMLRHPEQAMEAARLIGRGGNRFPSMREFRETYRQQVERMPRPREIEPVASGPRKIPDSVREWMTGRGLRTP